MTDRFAGHTGSILVVHSAAGHSGKTTLCRALVRDLPFDVYIKLAHRASHAEVFSRAQGSLPPAQGDTGRIADMQRQQGLSPLDDVLLVDGPRGDTDCVVADLLASWPDHRRVLVEGNCSSLSWQSRFLYVLPCPLPPTAKPDMAQMTLRADLVVVNRFPGCTSSEQTALLALLRDVHPGVSQIAGSLQDARVLEDIVAMVTILLPALAHS